MKAAIGIDLVEIETIKEKANERFINRILSDKEKPLYDAISHPKKKLEFLAGRFAAKEAYTKLYQRFEEPLNFKDVSVLKNENGAPYLESNYRNQDKILISISHSDHYVVAICQLVE